MLVLFGQPTPERKLRRRVGFYSPGLRLDIARRQADVAVRLARPNDGDLVCRKLGEFGMTRYASRAYIAAHGVPNRGQSFEGHTSVGYLSAPSWFNETLGGARSVLFSNSPYVQLAAMAAGVGIGIAPCCVGDEYPGLARLFPADLPELRPVWIVMHRDLRRVARIRVVANAITDAFERNRQLLRYGSHKGSAAKTRASDVLVAGQVETAEAVIRHSLRLSRKQRKCTLSNRRPVLNNLPSTLVRSPPFVGLETPSDR